MLAEAIKRFLLTKGTLDDDTKAFYAKALKSYQQISPEWPPTLETIVKFVNHHQTNNADSTTYVYYNVVRMFVLWLLKRRLIEDNPLEDLSTPRSPDDLPRALPPETLKLFFDHLETEVERVLTPGKKKPALYGWREIRDLAFFSLLLDTGLRLSEACNILVEDVDLQRRCIFVRHAKRKRQRFVAIGKRTRGDLKLWLTVRRKIDSDSHPLFLRSYRGWGGVTPAGMEQTLWQHCEDLGLEPKFTPHQFRHTYVDSALKAGADLREVQMQLGHINLRTTLRYAKGVVTDKRIKHHNETSPRDLLF